MLRSDNGAIFVISSIVLMIFPFLLFWQQCRMIISFVISSIVLMISPFLLFWQQCRMIISFVISSIVLMMFPFLLFWQQCRMIISGLHQTFYMFRFKNIMLSNLPRQKSGHENIIIVEFGMWFSKSMRPVSEFQGYLRSSDQYFGIMVSVFLDILLMVFEVRND